MQPQPVHDFGNGAHSGAAVLARTQNAVSYVRIRPSNSTSTPRRHDGFFFIRTVCAVLSVEAPAFCLRRVFIAYYRVSCYIFFSVSAGQHSKPRPCLLGLMGMYYRLFALVCFIIFLLSLYFLFITLFKNRLVLSLPRGLRAG